MSPGALFLTGATGFVGRRVLAALAPAAGGGIEREVRALVRGDASRLEPTFARVVAGELDRPEAWAGALEGCEVVLHLAALTGRARAREHLRVAAEGTRRLVEAARLAGVRRLVHVSTVAVRYPDLAGYPYARAKDQAERIVVNSGLAHVVVRPTIVLGPGAAAWGPLAALARLPLLPLPGGGRARIQPIDVDDLARALVLLVEDESHDGTILELGGPERLSFGDFLRRAHRAQRAAEPRALPVPVRPAVALLALWERAGLPLPPVTAGQLMAFVHDSDARPNALQERLAPGMLDVEGMLARMLAADRERAASAGAVAEGECAALCRYLGAEPTPYVERTYARACALRGTRPGAGELDRRLLAFARRGPWHARVADAFARAFAPDADLRRRLVLLLAVLESTPAAEQGLDRVEGATSPAAFAAGMVPRVAGSLLCLVAGTALFGPVRLLHGRGGPGPEPAA